MSTDSTSVPSPPAVLDGIHHIAISVENVATAVEWYRDKFQCEVAYQDETWGLLKFANISLALVIPGQHPPHIGFTSAEAEKYGDLKTHRDGTRSVYITDPFGNSVEMMDINSL